MTVLIVEDSRPAYLACRAQLSQYGFEHDHAEDGNQGREMANSNDYEFILMDLGLPFINGVDLTRELREGGCKTKIFALTANMRDYKKEDLAAAGVDIPFEKPLDSYILGQICKHVRIIPTKNREKLLDKIKPLDESNLLVSYYADFLPKMELPRSKWTPEFEMYLDRIKKALDENDAKRLTHSISEFYGGALHVNSVRLCLASLWPYLIIKNDESMINDENFRRHLDLLDSSANCYFEALKDERI